MDSRSQISLLVEKYRKIIEKREIGKYNEEMTKKDFILPLFRTLGWDTENSAEVTAEEKISKKRVDYGFRINGIPKFFLEAKSLKEDLDKKEFVEQAINYAWHKGCTWAVLTNFESIKIYNAEWKTGSWQSHLKTITYEQFLDRFDELWLLSKESFEKGLLDKEAEKWGKKTKKTPVDKQLLVDFTRFRELLSKNIAKLNLDKRLTQQELDESVQRMLDRLIFIRSCEDRELEEKILLSRLREWKSKGSGQLIKSLREVFAYFDKEYNSEIFKESLADQVNIDNDVLKEIIEGLYYTKDESIYYDFSAIEADVLGNIYEQYLGHILKKTKKTAKLTKVKTHRKEQGIYYTPTYIVDYIVQNTLGELLKDKKVDPSKIRVLDPACGSGSFLIKAFDVLNEYYKKRDKNYEQTRLDKDALPYSKKLEILQKNIFGVDLDKQAVEIARLNLLLKVAEKGKRLPLLKNNIKCGNSLIDDPSVAGDKAFKWEEEFREIMEEGGFDVFIGNPPYIKEFVNRLIFKDVKKGSSRVAKYYEGKMDYLYFFIELGIDLLKEGGYLSFITTNYWLQAEGAKKLREKILKETTLISVFDFNEFKVFEGTGQHNLVFVLQKKKNLNNKIKVSIVKNKNILREVINEALQGRNGKEEIERFISQPQKEFLQNEDFKIAFVSDKIENICKKLKSKQNYFLKEKDVATGIDVHQDKVIKSHLLKIPDLKLGEGIFVLSNEELNNLKLSNREKEIIKPYYTTENLKRYFADKNNKEWIIYTTTDVIKNINNYPKIKSHLDKFKKVITSDFGPYGLHRAREERFFLGEKIISLRKTKIPSFSYVNFPCYVSLTFFIIQPKDINLKYLTAILNSKIIYFWLYFKGKKEGNQLQIDKAPILQLPIKLAPESEQQPLIKLVDKMLSLNKRLNEIGDKKTDERAKIEEEIKKTDAEIDELVYKIYGITEEEKKIIEESLK
ncbi:MAG: N-6 DNA methylase [Candidatus Aenigmatarchaeota archaeon]